VIAGTGEEAFSRPLQRGKLRVFDTEPVGNRPMPTLDWIGKSAVVNHHRKVPYHLLRCDRELSAGDADAGNLLVQGDNLLALKALLPYYAGKVKCIYIDPPYNTGNEGWIYNDNVNSPEIRQWLRQTVGKEGRTCHAMTSGFA
jgi:adenine-specific DNA-methyltransferase